MDKKLNGKFIIYKSILWILVSALDRGMEKGIKKYLKQMEFLNKIFLAILVISVVVFLALWATIGFVLPEFFTDVRLFEKGFLFALWTIGAILFGFAAATFISSRGLRNAVRGK